MIKAMRDGTRILMTTIKIGVSSEQRKNEYMTIFEAKFKSRSTSVALKLPLREPDYEPLYVEALELEQSERRSYYIANPPKLRSKNDAIFQLKVLKSLAKDLEERKQELEVIKSKEYGKCA